MSIVLPPQIICSDCLITLKTLETGTFDLCLIDPPYFDYKTGHRKDKKGKLSQSLVQQDRDAQLYTVQECIRILKEGSSFWFFTNWQEAWWFQARFQPVGLLHNEIIWDKGNWTAGDLEGSLGNKYEVIFLGVKGKGWKYKGKRLHDIWGQPDDPYDLRRVGTNRLHPTEKPVNLYKKIIEISTDPGAFVFDPYVGSGASAIAAIETGRNYLGCEIDEEFHLTATRRIQEWKPQL